MNAFQKFDAALVGDCHSLIGVDEVGRGCLAGPVMAAACRLGADFFSSSRALELSAGFRDSKKLSASKRMQLLQNVEGLKSDGMLDYAVGCSSVDEIASLNILGATRLAMQRAIELLIRQAHLEADGVKKVTHEHDAIWVGGQRWLIQVDGPPLRSFPYPHSSLVKGDGRSLSIAIASVVAKTRRDAHMQVLDSKFPEYGLAQNKGYGTEQHRLALKQHGPVAEHRALFLRKLERCPR